MAFEILLSSSKEEEDGKSSSMEVLWSRIGGDMT